MSVYHCTFVAQFFNTNSLILIWNVSRTCTAFYENQKNITKNEQRNPCQWNLICKSWKAINWMSVSESFKFNFFIYFPLDYLSQNKFNMLCVKWNITYFCLICLVCLSQSYDVSSNKQQKIYKWIFGYSVYCCCLFCQTYYSRENE